MTTLPGLAGDQAPLPFLSIILPVRNEAASLPGLIEQLLRQDYPTDRFEILVADGGSTDGTREWLLAQATISPETHPPPGTQFAPGARSGPAQRPAADIARGARSIPLRLVDNPGIRSGAGRNAGVRAAQGDILLFIDGHCLVPSRSLLLDTARLLEQTGAACLCRPQPLLAPSPTSTGRIIGIVRACWLGHGRDSLIYNLAHSGFVDPASSGATYRREVFTRIGLYDEAFDACEDVEFNTRVRKAGFTAYSDPRLALYYQPRASLAGLWSQMVRYGRGRIRLMRKHPDTRSAAQLVPLGLLCSVAGTLVAGAFAPGLALVAALPVLLFAGAVLVATLQLGIRHGASTLLRAPAVFAAIYAGLGWGLLLELLRRGEARVPLQPGEDPGPTPAPAQNHATAQHHDQQANPDR